jgi:hypothetical protein
LPNFGKIVQFLRGMLVRFLNVLHFIDVCFIADDTLEKLPTASRVGKTKVGGVDFNRPRMRAVAHAVTALATSPEGFTASQLAQISTLSSPPQPQYGPRHAAYDLNLKKLRGKKLVEKIGSSHRYQPTHQGLRALTALLVLRDKVISPCWPAAANSNAGRRQRTLHASTNTTTAFRLACGTCSPRSVLPHEKDRQLFFDVVSVSV